MLVKYGGFLVVVTACLSGWRDVAREIKFEAVLL